MPKTDIEKRIRKSVDGFVAEISALVRQSALDVVEEALGAPKAPARRAKTRRKAKTHTRQNARPAAAGTFSGRRVRRAPEDIAKLADAVLAQVKSNPGQRLELMSRAMGIPSKELKRPIQTLLGAGELRTEGQKRGTMYFAGKGRAKTTRKKTGRKAPAKRKKAAKKAMRKTTAKRRKPTTKKASGKRTTSTKTAA